MSAVQAYYHKMWARQLLRANRRDDGQVRQESMLLLLLLPPHLPFFFPADTLLCVSTCPQSPPSSSWPSPSSCSALVPNLQSRCLRALARQLGVPVQEVTRRFLTLVRPRQHVPWRAVTELGHRGPTGGEGLGWRAWDGE